MVAKILNIDGSITKISGGVLSTEQPENPVAPEPITPQVLEPNPLAQAAHVIENLKGEEAALAKMNELMLDEAMNWFKIGGTLLQLLENKWFGGYGSFEELCWSEFGFKKSKAYHLMAIYKTLLDTDLKWADIQKLGWSKLRLLPHQAGLPAPQAEPGGL